MSEYCTSGFGLVYAVLASSSVGALLMGLFVIWRLERLIREEEEKPREQRGK